MALDLARLIFYSPHAAVQATRLHLAARKYGFLMVGKQHISLHVFFRVFQIHLVIFGRLIDDNTYVHGKFNIDVTPPPLPSCYGDQVLSGSRSPPRVAFGVSPRSVR